MDVWTDRLRVRDLQIGDADELVEVWTDPEVGRFMGDYGPRTPAEVHNWLLAVIKAESASARGSHNCAMVTRAEEAVVGWIGVGDSDNPIADWDFGYAVHPARRGRGYATEALAAVVAFCFDELSLGSVWGQCSVDNPASAAVMSRAGLVEVSTVDGERQFRLDRPPG